MARTLGADRQLRRLAEARDRADAAALQAGVAETLALRRARGDRFHEPKGGGAGARRAKDGLDWLYDKGRITHRQKLAGDKYGDDWRRCRPPGPRSCLDDTVRGYGDHPIDAKAHAEAMLARVRASALNGNAALAEACDRVCGEGLKPIEWAGGDDRLAGRYEERTQRALELLEAYYFG